MARDNVVPVRLDDDTDAFIAKLAAEDRRPKAQYIALLIEDFVNEHGFLDWKKSQAEERITRRRAV